MTIHGPKLRGFTAMAAAAALTAAGLIAAPAASAAPTTAAAEHALAIEGVIRVIPDETGSGVDEVAVVTESGAEIDITGVEVDGAVTGTAFEGTVALEGEVAAAAADADTAEAAEAAVAEAQTEPVEILEAEITPPTEAAVAAAAHTVDVMWLAPSGYARPALADVDAMVSRLDDFWRTQSDGQISGFTGTVKFGTVSAAVACDAQTTWNYAAGSSGFNRGSASWYWSAPNRRHLVTVVPGGLCGLGSGLGTVGTPHQGGLAWASVADDVTWWDQVVFHEIGHNIGLGHSNMTVCALPTVEGPGCEDWEYYDGYDVMGGGQMYSGITNFHDIAALNASHKVNIDALTRTGGNPGIATVTATTAPQTFTLSATGLDAGLRALEVRTPTGGRTFVEYRSAVGRDAAAFYKRVSGRTNHYPEGVRFLRLDCATQGCWGVDSTALRNSRGQLAYGEGETYRSLAVGDDPGFRVFVVALTTNTATVQVVAEQLVDLTGVGTPTVAGEPRVGARLTAVPGTWQSGVSFTYQWQVDGAAVAGATAATFVPRAADRDKTVSVTVTGRAAGYVPRSVTSAPTAPVGAGTLAAPAPTISGTAKVGVALTARPGTWTAGTALRYQWYVAGVAVSGATKATFAPTAAHVGRAVTVRVTGSLAGYTTVTTGSAATKAVVKGTMSPAKPKISGTKKVGKKLTAKPAAGAGLSYKYQWYANGKAIKGKTGKTFTLRRSDRGKKITVKVTYMKPGYTSVAKKSAATARIR